MKTVRMTDRWVRAISVERGREEYTDALVRGLRLRISPASRKWSVVTKRGGKQVRKPIGEFPDVSLADARERANKLLEAMSTNVSAGVSPPTTDDVFPRLETLCGDYVEQMKAKSQGAHDAYDRALVRSETSFCKFMEKKLGRPARAADVKQEHAVEWLRGVAADFPPGAAPPVGAVLEISRAAAEARPADHRVAAIAARHGSVYSDALHRESDPSSSEAFRLAHKQRLEALRRAGVVEWTRDGSWRLPKDFLERAAKFEDARAGARIRVLSWAALDQLAEAKATTFLDDALEGKQEIARVRAGFGEEIETALAARRRFLLANGLAAEAAGKLTIDRSRLAALERQTVNEAGAALKRETGKAFAPPAMGERIEGVYRRPVEIAGRRHAMIERTKEFALVPWRDALEKRRGTEVSGVIGRSGVRWSFDGKGRSLGV